MYRGSIGGGAMMITDVEDFFTKGCGRCARFETPDCSTQIWGDGVRQLREICLNAGLTETVKWGHACYTHAGRNIVIIGAFRDNFRLNFFNAGLLKDPEGVLEKQGAETKTPEMLRFTAADQVAAKAAIAAAYIAEAMGYAEAGIKEKKTTTELELPEELANALDADPEMAKAFAALTPGRRRSYVMNLNAAKQTATRINRIAKFREGILAGKGLNER